MSNIITQTPEFQTAQTAINVILNGDDPSADAIDNVNQMGKFSELFTEMVHAHSNGGTDAARKIYIKYAEQCPDTTALTAMDPEPEKIFLPLTLSQLLKLPPKEWIVNKIAGTGDLLMMYGAPGSGKTFAVIDLILSACTGLPWANRFEIIKPLHVAYCAGEGLSGLAGRFQSAEAYYRGKVTQARDPLLPNDDYSNDGELELPNFSFYDKVPQLYLDAKGIDVTESIMQFVIEREQPLDLLVLDTFHSAAAGADENSAQHASSIVKRLRGAAKKMGCAILLVHHTNKAGTAERGSSALRGAMDCMIEVKQTGNRHIIECAKLKDGGKKWIPQKFDLVAKGDSARVDWDEAKVPDSSDSTQAGDVSRYLAENSDDKFTASQLSEVIGTTLPRTKGLLADMVRQDKISRGNLDEGKKTSKANPYVYFTLKNGNPLDS